MIRVADYIAKTLADHGARHVFMVTGGGAMFLNDAFGMEKRIHIIFNHHEQACAMAAEGYARISGKMGIINVTTGPGGINALNGVFGAWTDSIPMLIISGQVKRETTLYKHNLIGKLRQLGDQEADIVGMVKGITKYALTIDDPQSIRYHLERATFLATNGRPGPCWLDIPIDVQSSMIDEATLPAYDPHEDTSEWDRNLIATQCREIIGRIRNAARPVILAGSGIRHAHAVRIFDKVIHHLGIPVTTAWTHDTIAFDDPLFCGRPGTIGERAGNFTVQNADVLLIIGSRLNIRQLSYNWKSFARYAFKIQVDVDAAELNKPTVKPDMAVHCDAQVFLEEFNRQLISENWNQKQHSGWLAWCRERLANYPVVLPKHRIFKERINSYHFIEELFRCLDDDDVVVCGNGTACIVPFQAGRLRGEQRMFSNSGAASMGHDLPAAIGAACARDGKRVICLAGDGSIQMNLQELQTIAHNRLPIKIFVLNNNGYLSIRTTQRNFFGRLVGESAASGVSFPDMVKIADAYGLPAVKVDRPDFSAQIEETLRQTGPILAEVMLDPDQAFEPRPSSKQLPDGRIVSAPLEDMFPFLDRDELQKNLLIPSAEN